MLCDAAGASPVNGRPNQRLGLSADHARMEARFVRHRAPETYAGRRYREGVKRWRRGIRPYLWLIFGPFALSSVVIGLLSHEHTIFLVGFIGGSAAGAMIALRDQPPSYLQTWGHGATGERWTHNALHSLGWHLVDYVDTGRGNYDHLLVGPAGVFMIETKNRSVWVQAVVVFWNDFHQERIEAGRVLYVHGSRIAGVLRQRERKLTPEGIAEIADVLDQLKHEGQLLTQAA
jgi:hypothetical protein